MNKADYLRQREHQSFLTPRYRDTCRRCIQPAQKCYCAQIHAFDPHVNFVILIHPIEVRRRIATGRMSHLCLSGSYLIEGQDFTQDSVVNSLIADPGYRSVILYPGQNATNISTLDENARISFFDPQKKLRIFVIDGTWATARKMIRSENLKSLSRICFTPEKPSNFRVRKQPHDECYSTIEAIHQTIELIGTTQGFHLNDRAHDRLIKVFDHMVESQLTSIRHANLNPKVSTYRREAQKKSA